MRKKSPMRIGLPLLFQELVIPRLPYRSPCILKVQDLRYGVYYKPSNDLPLSDLEFKLTYPDVALDLGRISFFEYNYIKQLQNYE